MSTSSRSSTDAASVADILPRAVALLARREHSRFDLGRKLRRYTDNPDHITAVLDKLQEQNLLSDERFVQVFVRSRMQRFGVRRLRYELNQQQIDSALIDAALAPLADDEYDRAYEVWQRKFGRAPQDQRDYARQYRFLAQRGFGAQIIRKILNDSP